MIERVENAVSPQFTIGILAQFKRNNLKTDDINKFLKKVYIFLDDLKTSS